MGKNKKKSQLNLIHRKGWKEFPSFTYPQPEREIGYVPKGFVQIVKEAVHSLDYFDKSVFDDNERKFLREVKANGYLSACGKHFGGSPDVVRNFLHHLAMIGQYIYDYIREKGMYEIYIPYCDIQVNGNNKGNFEIIYDALLSRDSPDGRIYYSRNIPMLAFEGKEYKVGFSKHAVDRICKRTVNNMDYLGMGNAFAYFKDSVTFELCSLPDGSPALAFLEKCTAPFFSGTFPKELIEDWHPQSAYKYRVGYCPLAFFEGFAKTITLLTPGMIGTPERMLLDNAGLDSVSYRKVTASIENVISMKRLVETRDFSALKWFHDHGIPQVIKV